MVMNPVTSQAAMRSAGELVRRAISAETIKIPEPIMEPMTSVVALVRPSSLASSLGCSAGLDVVMVPTLMFYPKIRRNSSTLLPGDSSRSEITATESAPASSTRRQFSRVMPPMATIGLLVTLRASLTVFRPTSGSGSCLERVAKIGPSAR